MNQKIIKTAYTLGTVFFFSALQAAPMQINNSEIDIDFYGHVRVDAIYDTAEFNSAQSPIIVQKQPAGRTPGAEIDIHPRLTRLGVNISQHNDEHDIDIRGKVEVDFQNGGSQSRELLRLRHAYIDIHKDNFSILMGQTWQTVSRLMPMANGDTLMWGAGNTGDRSTQIRATYSLPLSNSGKIDFEAAVQQMGTVDSKGQAGTNFGKEPAYQGRISFDMPIWTKNPFHIAAAVHQGTEVLAEKGFGEDTFNQFGIFTELILPIFDNWEIKGEYFQGENISDLRGGIVFGINAVTDKEIPTKGYWIETRFRPFENYEFGIGYGQDNPDDAYVLDGYPSHNEASWLVAHYQFTHNIKLGLEYLQWATEHKSDKRLKSDRYNANITWAF